MDLLLHLIDEAEVDINAIPIAEVTDQYLAYLRAMEELDLDIASEFVVMAATLLQIKARTLLPRPPRETEAEAPAEEEEGEDPRAELVARLVEYRRFKEAGKALAARRDEESRYFGRGRPDDVVLEAMLTPALDSSLTMGMVGDALARLLAAAAGRAGLATVRRELITVREQMRAVLRRLRDAKDGTTFEALLGPRPSRLLVVVCFLAILELARQRKVSVRQERPFTEIRVHYVGERGDDDESALTGDGAR